MSQNNHPPTPPSLTLNWEAYLPFFEDDDIPEDQKRELIEALWGIMVAFVDLGFGLNHAPQSCGQQVNSLTGALSDMLSCEHPETIKSNSTASQFGEVAKKEAP